VNVGFATPQERAAAFPAYNSLPPSVAKNLLLGTADVSAPDSPEGEEGAGYLWDSALRAGLNVRNYASSSISDHTAYPSRRAARRCFVIRSIPALRSLHRQKRLCNPSPMGFSAGTTITSRLLPCG